MAKTKRSKKLVILVETLGNDVGDVVEVAEETEKEVYYYDLFKDYCHFAKTEEGKAYQYINSRKAKAPHSADLRIREEEG